MLQILHESWHPQLFWILLGVTRWSLSDIHVPVLRHYSMLRILTSHVPPDLPGLSQRVTMVNAEDPDISRSPGLARLLSACYHGEC